MSTAAVFPVDEFSLPSGGVILKSSDGIEFKVYKNILSLASSFFCQMFTLPQPNDSGDSETPTQDASENFDDVQLIPVSEPSSTLAVLLHLIHPIPPPALPGLSETGEVTDAQALLNAVDPVLAAALKYDMPVLVKNLSSKLLDAAETTLPNGKVVDDTLALRVYVLACRHKLKEEARRAAHAALKGCVADVFIEELHQISGAQYFQLTRLHNALVKEIIRLLKKDAPPYAYFSRDCGKCNGDKIMSIWNYFVYHGLRSLLKSPRSSEVFSPSFQQSIFKQHAKCDCAHPQLWDIACRGLQEEIEMVAIKNDIDLSVI